MIPQTAHLLEVQDLAPDRERFAAEVLDGLLQPRKQLPCKYFYDRRGSRLFELICQTPEYYLTRAELAILRCHGREIAAALDECCLLVEFGSGSSLKTRVLLDHVRNPAGYVPIDISRKHLRETARRLARDYSAVPILPVCADYTANFPLPDCDGAARTVIFFPGSTIGNFEPQQARHFLERARALAGPGGGLLIGVDLKKDPAMLHAAYNDAQGLTAAFNLNLLIRINRELSGDFRPEQFAHYAFYNPRLGRVEMHLVSRLGQSVQVGGQPIEFYAAESIFTESSYKYTPEEFAQLAADAGFRLERMWIDEHRLFSVQYFHDGG